MSLVKSEQSLSRAIQGSQVDDAKPWSVEWYEAQVKALGEVACEQLELYAIPRDVLISVVVPIHNEERTLRAGIQRVCELPFRKEIVLVDDGSTDDTPRILSALAAAMVDDASNDIKVFRHEINRGKGAALRTGFSRVSGDIVIIQDADLEYDPAEYPRLIRPIIENKADVVYGSRFGSGRSGPALCYWHCLGNRLLTVLSNCFTNLTLTDIETCYKVFRRDVVDELTPKLVQNRFWASNPK